MGEIAYLILENGEVFEGRSFGAKRESIGELVFTTSMVGYAETLTDPSYYGQVVMQTFPLIGNYGVNSAEFTGKKSYLNAYIVREWCDAPSNFRSKQTINEFMLDRDVVGIYGVDTRRITKIIRENGVMNCAVTYSLDNMEQKLAQIKEYRVTNAVSAVMADFKADNTAVAGGKNVVLWNFGAVYNTKQLLAKYGCSVTTVPADTKAEEILALNPDGILLSNGAGDPTENTQIIEEIKKLLDKNIPMFGICLGHQLLALAMGANVQKLKYGHRGSSQPVKDIRTDKVYISSQNHGYVVESDTLPADAEIRFVNCNDNSCEGVIYANKAMSIQFFPEASGGPLDTEFLFDEFVNLMNN